MQTSKDVHHNVYFSMMWHKWNSSEHTSKWWDANGITFVGSSAKLESRERPHFLAQPVSSSKQHWYQLFSSSFPKLKVSLLNTFPFSLISCHFLPVFHRSWYQETINIPPNRNISNQNNIRIFSSHQLRYVSLLSLSSTRHNFINKTYVISIATW